MQSDELNCPICQENFTEVVETPCCSTGYCMKCLDSSLKNATNNTCPSCRKSITIFQCRPNKMVQRMVDNLPASCNYCSSKLTRGILQEHLLKCEKKPALPSIFGMCAAHGRPLMDFCEQDRTTVCDLCYVVGAHRHHHIRNNKKETVSLPSESESKTTKEDEMLLYCSLLLFQEKKDINEDNITEILKAANCPVPPYYVISEFAKRGTSVLPSWITTPKEEVKVDSNVSAQEEKTANEDYSQLKEKYNNELFNFEGVQVKVVPLCSHLLPKVKNHVYLLLELKVGKKKEEDKVDRPCYTVSLVLDRSGSMSGAKLKKAKEAITSVIENLDPKDSLHLLMYDNVSDLVFKNGTSREKDSLIQAVSKIEARGGTNLYLGLQDGFKVMKEEKKRGSDDLQKIFLFSDGCTNEGITDPTKICQLAESFYDDGVGTSAFGIGDDFDEKLMRGIAEKGHGHYFFIDASEKIPAMVEKAFRGLSRTVASNVVLKVKGSKGRKVSKLSSSDNVFTGIPLGDMREKDLKQIILQVEVEEDESLNPIDILEYEISYERKDEFIQEGPITGKMSMTTSNRLADLQKLDEEVLVYLKINECGDLDKTVLSLMDKNRLVEALALKREVVNVLTEISPLDRVGFAKVLLMKAKERLHELEQLSTGRTTRSYQEIKKKVHYDAEQEEDCDMGFGLFD